MAATLEPRSVSFPARPEGDPYFLTADDFYRMVDADIFPDDRRVGLWDGWIYEKMAKKQAHDVSSTVAFYTLVRVLPAGWHASVGSPVTLDESRVPLPDLVVRRGDPRDYRHRRAEVADVGLVIELADSSLKFDTSVKLEGYARAGIPTYWVFNLIENVIHAYTDPIPAEGRFGSLTTVAFDGSLSFQLGELTVGPIAASDLLPAP
jgi:Uma2 family endonuclease